jgi:type II secretory pathway pseudopilin PulG
MKLRLLVVLSILGVVAAIGSVALVHAQNDQGSNGSNGSNGRSYVITVTDSNGAFASRGVVALHADQTMSVIDSGQGGPTFFFSSQLGSWKPNGTSVVAKTIDFDFPPNADVARLHYTINFAQEHTEVTGTITLTTFPLQGNPLDGGGTVVGNFTFSGQLINP